MCFAFDKHVFGEPKAAQIGDFSTVPQFRQAQDEETDASGGPTVSQRAPGVSQGGEREPGGSQRVGNAAHEGAKGEQ